MPLLPKQLISRFTILFALLADQLKSFAQNRLTISMYPALEQRHTDMELLLSVAHVSGMPYLNTSGYPKFFPNLNPNYYRLAYDYC